MKTVRFYTIILAATFLGSCGVFKNYERPADMSVEGLYGDAQSGDSLGLGDLSWRTVFTDPQLKSLIEKALAQNSNMKQADLRIQQMQENLKASKLAFAPNLTFSPNGSLSGIFDPSDCEKYKGVMGNGMSKSYVFPLSMGWQIDCFGKLRNAKKKSEVAVENMKSVRQAVQASLVANVANLYYTLAKLDKQHQIAQETAETWRKNLEMTRMLFDAGQANRAAVSSTEANYWSICTSVVDIENGIRVVENSLCTLLGETPRSIDRSTLESFHTPSVCNTGFPISLLNRRPDVKQAELALASAFYDKNIAKASFYPSLNISASGQYTNSITGLGIVNPGAIILSALTSLTQPIFQNGKIRAAYKISQAEMEIATIGFQQTLIDAGSEVNTAMADIKAAESKKSLYENQVKSLQTAVDATQKLWDLTSINYLQILTAQSSLLNAQLSQVENEFGLVSATIQLYQALGGGTEE